MLSDNQKSVELKNIFYFYFAFCKKKSILPWVRYDFIPYGLSTLKWIFPSKNKNQFYLADPIQESNQKIVMFFLTLLNV